MCSSSSQVESPTQMLSTLQAEPTENDMEYEIQGNIWHHFDSYFMSLNLHMFW